MPDTTAKIQAILDDALRESFPEATDDARTRAIWRRQKLYGVGGGAQLPRLSRQGSRRGGRDGATGAASGASAGGGGAAAGQSRGGFPARFAFGEEGTVLSYASRPSDHCDTYEHDAWYRMSYWESTASHATNADRTFLGTSLGTKQNIRQDFKVLVIEHF